MVVGLDLSEFFVEKSFLATALAHIEGWLDTIKNILSLSELLWSQFRLIDQKLLKRIG